MSKWLALARLLPVPVWALAVLPALACGAVLARGGDVGAWFWWSLPPALLALALLATLAQRLERVRRERDDARDRAERDGLTGVHNRASWQRQLDAAVAARSASADAPPLSVLLFDIDLFKLVNDSLGHRVGDDCLRAVARTVHDELRGDDVLGRIGGEEFAVILPRARRVDAIAVAERVRMAVQARCRLVGEEMVELTVSVGAAEHLGGDESPADLLGRADRAMYLAKDSGRNLVAADAASAAPN